MSMTSFWDWLVSEFSTNLGMSLYNVIFIVFLLASVLTAAKDVAIGAITTLIISTLFFIWFYYAGQNILYPLSVMFASLIVLSFIVYSQTKKTGGGMV